MSFAFDSEGGGSLEHFSSSTWSSIPRDLSLGAGSALLDVSMESSALPALVLALSGRSSLSVFTTKSKDDPLRMVWRRSWKAGHMGSPTLMTLPAESLELSLLLSLSMSSVSGLNTSKESSRGAERLPNSDPVDWIRTGTFSPVAVVTFFTSVDVLDLDAAGTAATGTDVLDALDALDALDVVEQQGAGLSAFESSSLRHV